MFHYDYDVWLSEITSLNKLSEINWDCLWVIKKRNRSSSEHSINFAPRETENCQINFIAVDVSLIPLVTDERHLHHLLKHQLLNYIYRLLNPPEND